MPLSGKFYGSVRTSLFSGTLSETQVKVLDAINDECVKRNALKAQIAYLMATPYHEVGATLNPAIREFGWSDTKNYYSKPGAMSNHMQSAVQPYASLYYYGRGLSQLTWLDNYMKMGKKRGKDYAGDPDLLLQLDEGVWTLVEGCFAGDFTGKKITDFVNLSKSDFVGAREIYNGHDKDNLIASYAQKFYAALMLDDYVAPVAPDVPIAQAPIAAPPPSIWAKLGSWLTRKV